MNSIYHNSGLYTSFSVNKMVLEVQCSMQFQHQGHIQTRIMVYENVYP